MEDRDLEDLLRRCAAGEPAALDELVRRYEKPVLDEIRRRLGPALRARVESDDVLQSTFAAAIEDVRGIEYRGEKAFLGWLRTIAERRIRMAARRHGAARRDAAREVPADLVDEPASRRTTPSQAALRNEASEGVRRAMEDLPELEREVVRLHSFDGLSFTQVAARLGLSGKKAAHDAFRRALHRMSDRL